MKVILNVPVLGINGEILRRQTGRTLVSNQGQQSPVSENLMFANVAKDSIVNARVQLDSDVEMLYSLAEKLAATAEVKTPETLDLSDDEYKWVKQSIDKEIVVVRHAFLAMVAASNTPAVTDAPTES